VILDIEGASASRAVSSRLGWMLSLASASLAAVALLAVNALPREELVRTVPATRPSVLEQAFANAAAPRLVLSLPPEVAVPLAPAGSLYGSGPGRSLNAPRTYRLRGANDRVSVAPVPDAPPITAPADQLAGALSVHGNYAESWTVEPTSVSVLRWTENGTTYEISSRTLRPPDLARIAEQLR
jgi:hypothetical protein